MTTETKLNRPSLIPLGDYKQHLIDIVKENGQRWTADHIGTSTSNIGMITTRSSYAGKELYERIVAFVDAYTSGKPTPVVVENPKRTRIDRAPRSKKAKKYFTRIPSVHLGRLRELAEKHGQAWVGERTGLSSSGISSVLGGRTGVRPNTLAAVMELVGRGGVEAKSNGAPKKALAPVGIKRAVQSAASEAFAALSKLGPAERQRVLDALALIEGE